MVLEHHQQRQFCVDQEAAIHPLQSQHQTGSTDELEPMTYTSALEALRNALYKFKTYLLTYLHCSTIMYSHITPPPPSEKPARLANAVAVFDKNVK